MASVGIYIDETAALLYFNFPKLELLAIASLPNCFSCFGFFYPYQFANMKPMQVEAS
jgi:hypothetical protein